jgi:hypothetical protein
MKYKRKNCKSDAELKILLSEPENPKYKEIT